MLFYISLFLFFASGIIFYVLRAEKRVERRLDNRKTIYESAVQPLSKRLDVIEKKIKDLEKDIRGTRKVVEEDAQLRIRYVGSNESTV